jgi:hypothetical protein
VNLITLLLSDFGIGHLALGALPNRVPVFIVSQSIGTVPRITCRSFFGFEHHG